VPEFHTREDERADCPTETGEFIYD